MEPIEYKDKITSIRRKNESWFEDGEQKQAIELAIYTVGSVMQFALDDPRLPVDIEENWQNYLLCKCRFEPDKPTSNTGLTRVWFEILPNKVKPVEVKRG